MNDAVTGIVHVVGLLLSSVDKPPDWIARIAFISGFTCIVPLIIGAVRYRWLHASTKLLTINLLVALCAEILSVFLIIERHSLQISTQLVYNIYTPIEFALFILMFRYWHDGKTVRKLLTASIPVFLLFWIGMQLVLQYKVMSQVDLADVLLPVESLILIIVAIGTLVKIIRDETTPVVTSPVFWITAAILFYFTGNLFVFTFQSIILGETAMKQFWYVHSTMNFVKYGLFTVGLYLAGKYTRQTAIP